MTDPAAQIIQHLTALGEARALADTLAEQIKAAEAPHKAAAAAASKDLRTSLAEVGALLETLEPLCRSEYTAANAARNDALRAGQEVPRVALPAGCSVSERAHVVIDDPAQVPRELCAPVAGKVAAALKIGACAGAHVEKRLVFAFRACADAEPVGGSEA